MSPRHICYAASFLIGLALGQCTQPAHAEPLTVGLHIHSVHVPAKDTDNNSNWGLYGRTADGLTFGGYRNTLRRNSFYLGQTFEHRGFGLTLGAITGYKIKDGEGWSRNYLAPLAAVSYAPPVQILGATPRATLVPGHLVKARTVLHFSLEHSF